MSDNLFYLCTNLVLSSDFVQSSVLKSIHIWHNIYFTSLYSKILYIFKHKISCPI